MFMHLREIKNCKNAHNPRDMQKCIKYVKWSIRID